MCGIVGGIGPLEKTKNFVYLALEKTLHRGRDMSSVDELDNVVVGHNLLSITGIPTRQPLFDQRREVMAVVNGEFYDYKKLKARYPQYPFQTHSDSELVVALYESGDLFNALQSGDLNGEFAFFIYDSRIKKAYFGRDSFGIKPLYYRQDSNGLQFSSEIKSFLCESSLSFNEHALYSVLTMQYHNTQETLFEGVQQVQPGTLLELDLLSSKWTERSYFQMSFEENSLSLEENKEQVFSELKKSVARRLDTDKKIGFTLSGGIDSSSILALGSEFTSDINAYSISFEEGKSYDEYLSAKAMADRYGATFNPVIVDSRQLLDNMESAIYHAEQVSINSHLSSKYLLFKTMSNDGCKVSLSGEGSDEIFFGYPHFKLDIDIESSIAKNSYLQGLQMPDKDQLDTSAVRERLGFVPNFIKAKYSIGYKTHRHVVDQDFINKHQSFDPALNIINSYCIPKGGPVEQSSFLWGKVCLSNYILNALGDKLEMAHTLEGRVPFLDRKLFDIARSIPLGQKIFEGNEKYILKEAMKPYITQEIYAKQKHPFIAPPLLAWGSDRYSYDFIMDIIQSDTIRTSGFFSQAKLEAMVKNIREGVLNASSFDPIIMLVLSLYFLDKQFVRSRL